MGYIPPSFDSGNFEDGLKGLLPFCRKGSLHFQAGQGGLYQRRKDERDDWSTLKSALALMGSD